MRSKIISIIVTVAEVLVAVLCIVRGWAHVKMNLNWDLWADANFLDLSGWMNGYTATIVMVLCAVISVVMVWTSARRIIVIPAFVQTCILLRTWYEVRHFGDSLGGSGFTDGNMLPLGMFHCLLGIAVLIIGICLLFNVGIDKGDDSDR